MGILFYCMAFLGHQVSTIYRMNNLIIFKLLILLTQHYYGCCWKLKLNFFVSIFLCSPFALRGLLNVNKQALAQNIETEIEDTWR